MVVAKGILRLINLGLKLVEIRGVWDERVKGKKRGHKIRLTEQGQGGTLCQIMDIKYWTGEDPLGSCLDDVGAHLVFPPSKFKKLYLAESYKQWEEEKIQMCELKLDKVKVTKLFKAWKIKPEEGMVAMYLAPLTTSQGALADYPLWPNAGTVKQYKRTIFEFGNGYSLATGYGLGEEKTYDLQPRIEQANQRAMHPDEVEGQPTADNYEGLLGGRGRTPLEVYTEKDYLYPNTVGLAKKDFRRCAVWCMWRQGKLRHTSTDAWQPGTVGIPLPALLTSAGLWKEWTIWDPETDMNEGDSDSETHAKPRTSPWKLHHPNFHLKGKFIHHYDLVPIHIRDVKDIGNMSTVVPFKHSKCCGYELGTYLMTLPEEWIIDGLGKEGARNFYVQAEVGNSLWFTPWSDRDTLRYQKDVPRKEAEEQVKTQLKELYDEEKDLVQERILDDNQEKYDPTVKNARRRVIQEPPEEESEEETESDSESSSGDQDDGGRRRLRSDDLKSDN